MKTKRAKFVGITLICLVFIAGICLGAWSVWAGFGNIFIAAGCLVCVSAAVAAVYYAMRKKTALKDKQAELSSCARKDHITLPPDSGYEIRTYLNNILGFADVLRQEKLTRQQTEFVETIYVNANNLLEVVNTNLQGPDSSNTTIETQTEAQNQQHILIVDDVPENRSLIEIVLKKAGYKTTSCENGQEAVELAQKQKFSLILMDIQMPVMDGLEATRIIKSQSDNSPLAVLAMTASFQNDSRPACIGAGCDDVVSKPIKKEQLLKKVEKFTQQARQIQTAERGGDITSFFTDDPNYHKTIEMFVSALPDQVKQMQQALDEGNLQELSFKVHSLKGLGSFAGFPVYTEKARQLEQSISDNRIEKVREQLDELIGLCLRTRLTHH